MSPTTHTHDLEVGATEVRKTFVSWDRGEADREWACLTVLAEHAPGLAPRPLRRESTAAGAPVVVMERLPGTHLGACPLTPAQTTSLGAALRRMWDVPIEAAVAGGVPERLFGRSTHADLVVGWLEGTHEVDRCQDPPLVLDAVATARAWLAEPGHLPGPRLTSLGIADLNPANVIWDGRTCRLVDFEDGGLSEAAYELADHVEHLGGRRDGVYDVAGLVAAVGPSADEHERMRAYRPLWAAFWLAMLLPGNGGWHRNPPGTTEAQAVHLMRLLGG